MQVRNPALNTSARPVDMTQAPFPAQEEMILAQDRSLALCSTDTVSSETGEIFNNKELTTRESVLGGLVAIRTHYWKM